MRTHHPGNSRPEGEGEAEETGSKKVLHRVHTSIRAALLLNSAKQSEKIMLMYIIRQTQTHRYRRPTHTVSCVLGIENTMCLLALLYFSLQIIPSCRKELCCCWCSSKISMQKKTTESNRQPGSDGDFNAMSDFS